MLAGQHLTPAQFESLKKQVPHQRNVQPGASVQHLGVAAPATKPAGLHSANVPSKTATVESAAQHQQHADAAARTVDPFGMGENPGATEAHKKLAELNEKYSWKMERMIAYMHAFHKNIGPTENEKFLHPLTEYHRLL